MKRKLIIGLLLIAVLVGGLGYGYVWKRSRGRNGDLQISGNIEVIEAQVSFKIPGLVVVRPVDEGQVLSKDTPVAQLDTSDLVCEVAQRKAELAAAQAVLAALEAGSRPEEIVAAEAVMQKAEGLLRELENGSRPQEIEVAKATVASAQADRARAERDYQRASELYERKAIAAEEFDRSRSLFEVAGARLEEAQQRLALAKEGPRREEIDQARAALAQARAQYKLTKEGPRKEDILQGRAKVAQAEAALKLSQTKLGYATLLAPMPGVVLSKNIEPGEYVSPGTPVVTMANLQDIWLRGYVNYTDLNRLKVGQNAEVTTSACPGRKFEAYVSFISQQAEFTPKTVQTEQERVKLVYRIKVNIKNPQGELKPGMPADAVILED